MFYIMKNSQIVLSDSNRQRLVDTLPFLPEFTESDIQQTDQKIENFMFEGTPEHTAWKAKQVRTVRNEKLSETDKYALPDYPNEELREKYKIYRQALRDLTKQDGFPNNVVFPEVPE